MTDELGQVRMQLQLEKEALERARSQRAADRSHLHLKHIALNSMPHSYETQSLS